MKKMIKSLLVSAVVLGGPLSGVIGGQVVEAQDSASTELTLTVKDNGKLLFTNKELATPLEFSLELVYGENQHTLTSTNNFTIGFEDTRVLKQGYIIQAEFVPININNASITINSITGVEEEGGSPRGETVELSPNYSLLNPNDKVTIIDNLDNVVLDKGKGSWKLNFTNNELQFDTNATTIREISDNGNVGSINWTLGDVR